MGEVKMRTLLIGAILALFSTHSYALDQNAVNAEIASIKQKVASGQDVKADIATLTEKLKADAHSLVVSNQVNLSVIDKSGTVSLFVPFPATTHVIAKGDEHIAAAIAKHPQASKAHNLDNLDGSVSLGGSSKKKSKTPTATADPATASTDSSSGGIGGLISAGIGAAVNVVGGLVSGVLGAI
jgi:hypothetical protein